jgi:dihydrofolate reductase
MRLSVIAAVAENGVIGRGGKLPWHLADDLKRFKSLTMGHTIIMGRRTWESIDGLLPGRRLVVVSRNSDFRIKAGVETAASLDTALAIAASAGDEEAFVIGGMELYREALPRADRLYLTHVHAAVVGDTYFPTYDREDWQQLSVEWHTANAKNEYPFSFEVFDRSNAETTKDT